MKLYYYDKSMKSLKFFKMKKKKNEITLLIAKIKKKSLIHIFSIELFLFAYLHSSYSTSMKQTRSSLTRNIYEIYISKKYPLVFPMIRSLV